MTIYTEFPSNVLPPNNVSLAPMYNTRPGPQATNGMHRSLGMSGAQWKMQFNVFVHDERTARALRGFLFNMEADSNLIRIRMPDRYGIDGPYTALGKANRGAYPLGIPFANDVFYSSGVGHAHPTLTGSFHSASNLGAREIYANVETELPGGCAISIDGFCYGIAGSWMEANGSNRLKLSPVLRKAAAVNDRIDLAPIFIGSCNTEAPGYEAMTAGMYGFHTLEFVEDLTRLVELA